MVNLGFWANLNKPILCLAPMADVTDSAFRHVIAKCSKGTLVSSETTSSLCTDIRLLADSSARLSQLAQGMLGSFSDSQIGAHDFVMWTEFVSADGLALAPEDPPARLSLTRRAGGRKRLMKGLEYSEIERPIVAQFFTSKPEHMEKAAMLGVELGFDGVDINMGCPDKSVEKQGAGAALIKNPSLARELIEAAKRGISDGAKKYNKSEIPISVKTRLGYNKDELEEWLPALLLAEPAVITIHARTRKEMSKVPARWERIKRAVEIRDEFQSQKIQSPETLIFGNGDVRNVTHAYELVEETGCDGVMLGRAIFGDPFLFATSKASALERVDALLEHVQMFDKNLSLYKSFAVMKKHFKSYLNHVAPLVDDSLAHENKNKYLTRLMDSKTPGEAINILLEYKKSL